MPEPSLHDDALATLRGWTTPDAEQERLRTTYVAHLQAHPDGVLREPCPDHLTASTLVLSADRSHVLLTLHRKAQRWFQLGGHLEPDDARLVDAALREATEESGIPDLLLDPTPVRLDLHPVPFCHADGRARHLDVQFVTTAQPHARGALSEESLDLRWWPVDDLPAEQTGVRELVEAALRRS